MTIFNSLILSYINYTLYAAILVSPVSIQIFDQYIPMIYLCQVYKKYNKILCVVATNVSTMSVEYFHPKTTPDFPVALAVRSSMALPGKLNTF